MSKRRFTKSYLLLALPILITSSAALAGNVVSSERQRWPGRSVAVVVCDADATARECGSTRAERRRNALSRQEATAVRRAFVSWRNHFSGHIVFAPAPRLSGRGVVFQAPQRPMRCSTRFTGYRRAEPVNRVLVGSNCNARKFSRTTEGSILHELMHVAGAYHEQQRSDRRKYITVRGPRADDRQWGRICKRGACAKGDREATPSGSYDFASIMHYSLPRGSSSPRVSLTSAGRAQLRKQGLARSDVGQREQLSAGDVMSIKRLYPRATSTAIRR